MAGGGDVSTSGSPTGLDSTSIMQTTEFIEMSGKDLHAKLAAAESELIVTRQKASILEDRVKKLEVNEVDSNKTIRRLKEEALGLQRRVDTAHLTSSEMEMSNQTLKGQLEEMKKRESLKDLEVSEAAHSLAVNLRQENEHLRARLSEESSEWSSRLSSTRQQLEEMFGEKTRLLEENQHYLNEIATLRQQLLAESEWRENLETLKGELNLQLEEGEKKSSVVRTLQAEVERGDEERTSLLIDLRNLLSDCSLWRSEAEAANEKVSELTSLNQRLVVDKEGMAAELVRLTAADEEARVWRARMEELKEVNSVLTRSLLESEPSRTEQPPANEQEHQHVGGPQDTAKPSTTVSKDSATVAPDAKKSEHEDRELEEAKLEISSYQTLISGMESEIKKLQSALQSQEEQHTQQLKHQRSSSHIHRDNVVLCELGVQTECSTEEDGEAAVSRLSSMTNDQSEPLRQSTSQSTHEVQSNHTQNAQPPPAVVSSVDEKLVQQLEEELEKVTHAQQQRVKRLEKELSQHAETVDEQRARIFQLERDLRSKTSLLEGAEEDGSRHQSKLKSRMDDLEVQLTTAMEENMKKSSEIAQLRRNLSDSTIKYEDLERVHTIELNRLNGVKKTLAAREDEFMALTAKYDVCERERRRTTDMLAILEKDGEHQESRMRTALETKESQITSLESTLSECQQNLRETSSRFSILQEDFEKVTRQLDGERSEREQVLGQLRTNSEASEDSITKLRQTLLEAEGKYENEHQKCIRMESELATVKPQLEEKINHVSRLEQSVSSLQLKATEQQQETWTAVERARVVESQMSDKSRRLEEAEEKLRLAESRLSDETVRVRELDVDKSIREVEMERYKGQIQILEGKITQQDGKIEENTAVINNLNEEKLSLLKDTKRITGECEELQKALQKKEKKLSRLQQSMRETESELVNRNTSLSLLQEQLEVREGELEQLKTRAGLLSRRASSRLVDLDVSQAASIGIGEGVDDHLANLPGSPRPGVSRQQSRRTGSTMSIFSSPLANPSTGDATTGENQGESHLAELETTIENLTVALDETQQRHQQDGEAWKLAQVKLDGEIEKLKASLEAEMTKSKLIESDRCRLEEELSASQQHLKESGDEAKRILSDLESSHQEIRARESEKKDGETETQLLKQQLDGLVEQLGQVKDDSKVQMKHNSEERARLIAAHEEHVGALQQRIDELVERAKSLEEQLEERKVSQEASLAQVREVMDKEGQEWKETELKLREELRSAMDDVQRQAIEVTSLRDAQFHSVEEAATRGLELSVCRNELEVVSRQLAELQQSATRDNSLLTHQLNVAIQNEESSQRQIKEMENDQGKLIEEVSVLRCQLGEAKVETSALRQFVKGFISPSKQRKRMSENVPDDGTQDGEASDVGVAVMEDGGETIEHNTPARHQSFFSEGPGGIVGNNPDTLGEMWMHEGAQVSEMYRELEGCRVALRLTEEKCLRYERDLEALQSKFTEHLTPELEELQRCVWEMEKMKRESEAALKVEMAETVARKEKECRDAVDRESARANEEKSKGKEVAEEFERERRRRTELEAQLSQVISRQERAEADYVKRITSLSEEKELRDEAAREVQTKWEVAKFELEKATKDLKELEVKLSSYEDTTASMQRQLITLSTASRESLSQLTHAERDFRRWHAELKRLHPTTAAPEDNDDEHSMSQIEATPSAGEDILSASHSKSLSEQLVKVSATLVNTLSQSKAYAGLCLSEALSRQAVAEEQIRLLQLSQEETKAESQRSFGDYESLRDEMQRVTRERDQLQFDMKLKEKERAAENLEWVGKEERRIERLQRVEKELAGANNDVESEKTARKDEEREFRKTIEELKSRLDGKGEERVRLESSVKELEGELKRKISEIDELCSRIEEKEATVSQLEDELRASSSVGETLSAQVKQLQDAKEGSESKVEMLQERVSTLLLSATWAADAEEEIQRLTSQSIQGQKTVHKLQEDIEALEGEREATQREVEVSKEKEAELQRRIAELEGEVQRTEQKALATSGKLKSRLEIEEAKVKSLQVELAELKGVNTALKEKERTMAIEIASLQTSDSMWKEVEEKRKVEERATTKAVSTLEATCAKLSAELEESKGEALKHQSSLETQRGLITEKEEESSKLKKRVEELQRDLEGAIEMRSQLESQVMDLVASVEAVQEAKNADKREVGMSCDMGDVEEGLRKEMEHFQRRGADLEAQLGELRKEKASMLQEMDSLREKWVTDAQAKASYEAEVTALRPQSEKYRMQMEELEQRFQTASSTQDMDNHTIAQLEAKVQVLQVEVQSLRNHSSMLEREVKESGKREDVLQMQLASAEGKVVELEATTAELGSKADAKMAAVREEVAKEWTEKLQLREVEVRQEVEELWRSREQSTVDQAVRVAREAFEKEKAVELTLTIQNALSARKEEEGKLVEAATDQSNEKWKQLLQEEVNEERRKIEEEKEKEFETRVAVRIDDAKTEWKKKHKSLVDEIKADLNVEKIQVVNALIDQVKQVDPTLASRLSLPSTEDAVDVTSKSAAATRAEGKSKVKKNRKDSSKKDKKRRTVAEVLFEPSPLAPIYPGTDGISEQGRETSPDATKPLDDSRSRAWEEGGMLEGAENNELEDSFYDNEHVVVGGEEALIRKLKADCERSRLELEVARAEREATMRELESERLRKTNLQRQVQMVMERYHVMQTHFEEVRKREVLALTPDSRARPTSVLVDMLEREISNTENMLIDVRNAVTSSASEILNSSANWSPSRAALDDLDGYEGDGGGGGGGRDEDLSLHDDDASGGEDAVDLGDATAHLSDSIPVWSKASQSVISAARKAFIQHAEFFTSAIDELFLPLNRALSSVRLLADALTDHSDDEQDGRGDEGGNFPSTTHVSDLSHALHALHDVVESLREEGKFRIDKAMKDFEDLSSQDRSGKLDVEERYSNQPVKKSRGGGQKKDAKRTSTARASTPEPLNLPKSSDVARQASGDGGDASLGGDLNLEDTLSRSRDRVADLVTQLEALQQEVVEVSQERDDAIREKEALEVIKFGRSSQGLNTAHASKLERELEAVLRELTDVRMERDELEKKLSFVAVGDSVGLSSILTGEDPNHEREVRELKLEIKALRRENQQLKGKGAPRITQSSATTSDGAFNTIKNLRVKLQYVESERDRLRDEVARTITGGGGEGQMEEERDQLLLDLSRVEKDYQGRVEILQSENSQLKERLRQSQSGLGGNEPSPITSRRRSRESTRTGGRRSTSLSPTPGLSESHYSETTVKAELSRVREDLIEELKGENDALRKKLRAIRSESKRRKGDVAAVDGVDGGKNARRIVELESQLRNARRELAQRDASPPKHSPPRGVEGMKEMYEERIHSLKQRLEDAQVERERLRRSLRDAEFVNHDHVDKSTRVRELEKENEKLRSTMDGELQELRDRVAAAEEERDKWRNKLRVRTKEMESEIDAIEKDRGKLRATLSERTAQLETKSSLLSSQTQAIALEEEDTKAQLKSLSEDNHRLTKALLELKSSSAALQTDLHRQVREAEHREGQAKLRYKEACQAHTVKTNAMRRDLLQTEEALTRAKTAQRRSEEEISRLEGEGKVLREELKSTVDKSAVKYDELSKEQDDGALSSSSSNIRWKAEAENYKTQLSRVQKYNELEMSAVHSQISQLKEERRDLERETSEAKAHSTRLTLRVEEAEQSLVALTKEKEEMNERVKEMEEIVEKSRNEVVLKLGGEDELSRCQGDLRRANERLREVTLEIKRLEVKLAERETKEASLMVDNSKMNEEIASLKRSIETERAKRLPVATPSESDMGEGKPSAGQRKEVERLQDRIQDLERTIESLQRDRARAVQPTSTSSPAKGEEEARDLRKEVHRLKAVKSSHEEEITQLETEVEELRANCRDKDRQIRKLEATVGEMEADKTDLSKQLAGKRESDTSVLRLEGQLRQIENDKAEWEQVQVALEGQVESLRKRVEREKESRKKTEAEMSEEHEKDVSELREKIATLSSERKEAVKELDEAAAKVETLEEEVEKLKAQKKAVSLIQKKDAEERSLMDELSAANDNIEVLMAEKEALQTELERCETHKKALITSASEKVKSAASEDVIHRDEGGAEYQRVKERLAKVQLELSNKSKELSKATSEMSELKASAQEVEEILRQERDKAMSNAKRLRQELEEVKREAEAEAEDLQRSQRLSSSSLTRDVSFLKQSLERVEGEKATAEAALEEERKAAAAGNQKWEAKLKQLQREHDEEIQSMKQDLKQRIALATAESQLNSKESELEDQLHTATDQVRKLKREKAELEREIGDHLSYQEIASRDLEQLRKTKSDLEKNVRSHQQRLEEEEEETTSLSNQLADAKAAARSKDKELRHLKEKLEEAKEAVERESEKRNKETLKEKENEEKRRELIEQQLSMMEVDAREGKECLKAAMDENKELRAKIEELESRQQQSSSSTSNSSPAEGGGDARLLDMARAKIAVLEKEKKELQAELAFAANPPDEESMDETSRDALRSQLAQVKSDRDKMSTAFSELERQLFEAEGCREELVVVRRAKDEATTKARRLELEVEDKDREIQELKKQAGGRSGAGGSRLGGSSNNIEEELNKQVEELSEGLMSVTKERDHSKAQVFNLESQLRKVDSQVVKLEEEITSLAEQNTFLSMDNQNLTAMLSELEASQQRTSTPPPKGSPPNATGSVIKTVSPVSSPRLAALRKMSASGTSLSKERTKAEVDAAFLGGKVEELTKENEELRKQLAHLEETSKADAGKSPSGEIANKKRTNSQRSFLKQPTPKEKLKIRTGGGGGVVPMSDDDEAIQQEEQGAADDVHGGTGSSVITPTRGSVGGGGVQPSGGVGGVGGGRKGRGLRKSSIIALKASGLKPARASVSGDAASVRGGRGASGQGQGSGEASDLREALSKAEDQLNQVTEEKEKFALILSKVFSDGRDGGDESVDVGAPLDVKLAKLVEDNALKQRQLDDLSDLEVEIQRLIDKIQNSGFKKIKLIHPGVSDVRELIRLSNAHLEVIIAEAQRLIDVDEEMDGIQPPEFHIELKTLIRTLVLENCENKKVLNHYTEVFTRQQHMATDNRAVGSPRSPPVKKW